MTRKTSAVLSAFLADPARHMFGYELRRACGLSVGALYPLLVRLENQGWLISDWVEDQIAGQSRPIRRRAYRITQSGAAAAARADQPAGPVAYFPYHGVRAEMP